MIKVLHSIIQFSVIYFFQTAQADRNALQQRIEEKDRELQNLQKQISDLEREKQAELVKLRLEYDAKLLKVQKHNAKANMQVCYQHYLTNLCERSRDLLKYLKNYRDLLTKCHWNVYLVQII